VFLVSCEVAVLRRSVDLNTDAILMCGVAGPFYILSDAGGGDFGDEVENEFQ